MSFGAISRIFLYSILFSFIKTHNLITNTLCAGNQDTITKSRDVSKRNNASLTTFWFFHYHIIQKFYKFCNHTFYFCIRLSAIYTTSAITSGSVKAPFSIIRLASLTSADDLKRYLKITFASISFLILFYHLPFHAF